MSSMPLKYSIRDEGGLYMQEIRHGNVGDNLTSTHKLSTWLETEAISDLTS